MTLYYIDARAYKGATGGIVVDEMGVCREAAPIFRWMIGKSLWEISQWDKISDVVRTTEDI